MEDNVKIWAKMSVCLLNMIMFLHDGLRLPGSEVFLSCVNFANLLKKILEPMIWPTCNLYICFQNCRAMHPETEIKVPFRVGELKTIPQWGRHEASYVQGIKHSK